MQLTPHFDAGAISARISELGREIRAAAGDDEVFLLGVLKGSCVFLADLLRAIDGKVDYGFIDVVRDVADTLAGDALEIDYISTTDVAGKNVYLLKDVVSTGVIETYLLAQIRMHEPRVLKLVALLDRQEARTVELEADFRAFTVEGGQFGGYGLEGEGSNHPWIGRRANPTSAA